MNTAHDSKSGQYRIILSEDHKVWAIRIGTHDASHAQNFKNRDDARKYANPLWRTI